MIDRVVYRRPEWATVLGSALVLIGLALFMIVFVTLFPVLTDPVGAYDRWFPVDEAAASPPAVDDARPAPVSRFSWEAVVVESVEPPVYRTRLHATALPGDADLVAWRWDLGDGSEATGETVVHDYPSHGSYIVTLTVEDSAGATDTLAGEVVIPGIDSTAGTVGRVDELLDVDIEASLEDAVGSVGDEITATIDTAFGSIAKTVRGAVVVALFALAALATTIVAWRVARIGVMVLTQSGTTGRKDGTPPPDVDERQHRERQLELV